MPTPKVLPCKLKYPPEFKVKTQSFKFKVPEEFTVKMVPLISKPFPNCSSPKVLLFKFKVPEDSKVKVLPFKSKIP